MPLNHDVSGLRRPRCSPQYGLTSPTLPEALRRETVFVYSQGWPPAFLGDLYYYIEDHELRTEAASIDAAQCPVHLLSGEYDHSATPGHCKAAHEAIPGSTFSVMQGPGHFPMAENPQKFIEILLPVLDAIEGAAP